MPRARREKQGRARAIAILGTGSDVGKSVITAGLCRLLHRAGVRVAPFKAQNMSLNSFVTVEGGEMGRAQVLQAEACGLVPHVDMNPILLKPESDARAQVIVQGKVWGHCEARDYPKRQKELFRVVRSSYDRLARRYDVMMIEGAGSAAELNLRDRDLVNWPVVEHADAAVLLVSDIDRGGVFAQVIGTVDLLSADERRRLLGVVVNKFRGDASLFEDGVDILEARTGVPVLGVLPFLRSLELDQEDSVEVEKRNYTRFSSRTVNIAVILLPRMSNFTDFNTLTAEPDVALRYVATPDDIAGADVVVLPGSKNTIADLEYLRMGGFFTPLHEHVRRGGELVGICGGYQMLGRSISDPHRVEAGGEMQGLGLLDVDTELQVEKTTIRVEASPLHVDGAENSRVSGYEIHMGVTRRKSALPCFHIFSRLGHRGSGGHGPSIGETFKEGAVTTDRLVWGTSIHGVFDQPEFRRLWLNQLRRRRGLAPLDIAISEVVTERLGLALDHWADHLQKNLNMVRLCSALGL